MKSKSIPIPQQITPLVRSADLTRTKLLQLQIAQANFADAKARIGTARKLMELAVILRDKERLKFAEDQLEQAESDFAIAKRKLRDFEREITLIKNPPEDAKVVGMDPEDPENDLIMEQIDELRAKVPLGVSYTKNPTLVAIDPETNELYGVVYTEVNPQHYDFDIIVDPDARRKGVAGKLIDAVISDFINLKDCYEDLVIHAYVINPDLVPLLTRKGFELIEEWKNRHWIMEYRCD